MAKKKVYDYAKPTRHQSQKGPFVGNPAKTHIHIVGSNTHVTVAGDRKNFNENTEAGLQIALGHLNDYASSAGTSGYDNCHNWVTSELAIFNPL